MRNLNKPPRYNVASIQAQQTLGGDVMQSDENGLFVEWRDYKWLLDSYASVRDQWKDLDSEVERLKAVSTIEQRTIQGLQQTPEWSEIARLTAYCRELEGKVERLEGLVKYWQIEAETDHAHWVRHAETNERLRKAGDELAWAFGFAVWRNDGEPSGLIKDWHAAKEGKPSV